MTAATLKMNKIYIRFFNVCLVFFILLICGCSKDRSIYDEELEILEDYPSSEYHSDAFDHGELKNSFRLLVWVQLLQKYLQRGTMTIL